MWFADPDAVAQHRAAHDSMRHDIRRLFDELNEDQLRTMTLIMDSVSTADNPALIASHMAGRLMMIREFKYKACSACDANHDADLEQLTTETCPTCGSSDPKKHPATQADGGEVSLCSDAFHTNTPSVEVPPHVQARRAAADIVERGNVCPECGSDTPTRRGTGPTPCFNEWHTVERVYTPIGSTAALKDWEIEEMKLYNLDDLRNEGSGELIGFWCINCHQTSPTIQDRMIRPPGVEGCSGCQQKARFG